MAINRVLLTADSVGGVWNYALELTAGLGSHGIDVALATMGQGLTKNQFDQVKSLRNCRLFESEYKLEWMEDPWTELDLAASWLQQIADDVQPQIVHLNQYYFGSLRWACPFVMVGHSCVGSWYEATEGKIPDSLHLYIRMVKEGLVGADCVVAPSHTMLSALKRIYTPPLRSYAVIPNGRSGEFTVGAKEPFVFSAGRLWDRAKNIAAVAAIAEDLPWHVRIAGADSLQSDSISLSRNSNISYLGYLSPADIADQFSRASIYLFPARYEPFGLSVLEAAMNNCALVLGDIPSLHENWNGAALFVPPDDQKAIRSVVLRLINDEPLRNELAFLARNRARQFSADRMTHEYLKVYRSLHQSANISPPTMYVKGEKSKKESAYAV